MSSDAPEDDPIVGSLRSMDGVGVVRIEGRFNTGIDDLWSAITDAARVAHWYGRVDGDLRPDGEIRLAVTMSGWAGTGRIKACEPPSRLLLTTRESDESRGQGRETESKDVAIETTLNPDGEQSVLVFEIRGLPLEMVHFYGAGWQIHAEHLAEYLDGRGSADVEKRFAELVPAYEALAAKL